MGDGLVSHAILCARCHGTGTYLGDSGRKVRCGCKKKIRRVHFTIGDAACEYCEQGQLVLSVRDEYGFNRRKELRRNIKTKTMTCPCCFGTGKQHFMWFRFPCESCKAEGKTKKTFWQKARFNWEVYKSKLEPCAKCNKKRYIAQKADTPYDGTGYDYQYNDVNGSDFC